MGQARDEPERTISDAGAAARLMGLLRDGPVQVDATGAAGASGSRSDQEHSHESTHGVPSVPGYVVARCIGQGSGGVVYEARREGSEQRVALKVMRQPLGSGASAQRAWREMDVLSQLHLPAVPRLLDYGQAEGHMYVVTEFVEGVALDVFCGPLDQRARVNLLRRVAEAVQSVHERGVIHRDIKPSNVLVTLHGDPVIIDFGVAALTDVEAMATLTETGAPVGSVAFMSPEQARGDRGALSTRSDVYALGATGYVLLTGQTPHAMEGSVHACIRRVADEAAREPRALEPGLPKPLAAVLRKACAREPGGRYESAQALADDLGRWGRGEGVEAEPPMANRGVIGWARRHPLSAIVAVGLAAALGGWWWASRPITPVLLSECVPDVGGNARVTGIAVVEDRVIVVGAQSTTGGEGGLLLEFDRDAKHPIGLADWPREVGRNSLEAVVPWSDGPGETASIAVGGGSLSLTKDTVVDAEPKGIVARMGVPVSNSKDRFGRVEMLAWTRQTPAPPGAFQYGGEECVTALATSWDRTEPCVFAAGVGNRDSGHFRPFVVKLDTAGSILWTWGDASDRHGTATGVATIAGSAFVCGWEMIGSASRPTLRRFDRNGQAPLAFAVPGGDGGYTAVCRVGDSVVAVGWLGAPSGSASRSRARQTITDAVVIDRWDVNGRLVWRREVQHGPGDHLRAVAMSRTSVIAVGSTRTGTRGGSDCLILEVAPADGAVLSRTLYGGSSEDEAIGVACDGEDVYVTGMTQSFPKRVEHSGLAFPLVLRYRVAARER